MAATTIVIACPICMQKIRAPEGVIGRQVKCPQCKNAFVGADPNAVPSQISGPASSLGETSVGEVPSVNGTPSEVPQVPMVDGQKRSSPFVDFLLLRRAMAPAILVPLFYVGLIGLFFFGIARGILTLAGLVTRQLPIGPGLLSLAETFFGTLFLAMLWRVVCEVFARVFREPPPAD